MKKTKRLISLILSFVLIISTFATAKISAYTTNPDTKYSDKKIQNGSFEQGEIAFSNGYKAVNKSTVEYWDTTATDGMIEFFNNDTKYHFVTTSNAKYKKVADGERAVELNANEESSIYQRINTVAGSTYTWGLYHRGRERTDRMVLIIGPEQPNDPVKTSRTGRDQFIRITNWLKTQYGVDYPEVGCSKKYTVYSRPFAASGKFKDESKNEDENISLTATNEINQEWSVWVISSPYCNTNEETTVNGWSAYGTNAEDDINDIMKGASSNLGYDCTYTVPKGQTKTIFAFCSFSSGRATQDDITYGNYLDGVDFKLYQPVSSSITEGGIGGAYLDNISIKSDIISGDSLYTIVPDGKYCTIYTTQYNDAVLKDCAFAGAYVTVNNADGTSVTRFLTPYEGTISEDADKQELAKDWFIEDPYTDENGKEWTYYLRIPITSPVSVHLVYTKAPFILYDSNGGTEYYFSPDNKVGGNLVGFADYFQKVFDKEIDGENYYVDTSDYYSNYEATLDEAQHETVIPGKYISHAALPNDNWEKNSDGTSPHKFCGWSVLDADGKQVVLDGEHTATYNPAEGNGGIVSFTDSDGTVENLLLDATHGVTLSALWKFVHRAQAQTYVSTGNGKGNYENSAVGGTVTETLIPDELRSSDIKEYTENVNGVERVECVDAAGEIGDKIMFKATPDSENNYAFVGWYYRAKQADGTYKEELRSTSTAIAVTVEEGKLNTYYARFQKKSVPVLFYYSPTGSKADYDYYDKSPENKYGKYFQEVIFGDKAVKPSGDLKSVKTWFTSPTERGSEYIFDFENTVITQETKLYAGPPFTYNYFNYFRLQEPWSVDAYGTLKFDGKYIDLKNDTDVTDFNVYMLKGTAPGESAPSPSEIKRNISTEKVGKSVNNDKLIFNSVTNKNQKFNRAGADYNNFYLFNMKTPVWVVFDFTYKGVTYTSTVKDRSLYNCITTYKEQALSNNGLYTSYPPETQQQLRTAQDAVLDSIKKMYDEVSKFEISEPTVYANANSVSGLTYDPSTDSTYTFESTTAIRNIEPWGLKYSFTVADPSAETITEAVTEAVTEAATDATAETSAEGATETTAETTTEATTEPVTNNIAASFADYGAVILTDKDGVFDDNPITVNDMLANENSVMYSKSGNNVYSGKNGAIDIFYINNMLALDFDKNTYAVFFVKDSEGKCYYSNIVTNNYNDIASKDVSEFQAVSASIADYSQKLKTYCTLMDEAKNANP